MDLLTDLVERAERAPKAAAMVKDLKAAIPIAVQNVANYLYVESPQEVWDLHQDFPNIAPAWPLAFFSWKTPRTQNSEGKIIQYPVEMAADMGVLMVAHDVSKEPVMQPIPLVWGADIRWVVSTIIFMRVMGRVAFKLVGYPVTKEGEFRSVKPETDDRYHFIGSSLCAWPEGSELPAPAHWEDDHTMLYVPFLTLCFTHCKNVVIERKSVPSKVLRKRERNHGWSPEAWHELQIQPMKKTLAGTGASTLQRALHICRGHFKDYRDGRGLFGKHRGLYWWDFHLTDSSHPHRYTVSP